MSQLDADVCIVGGGPAGLSVACGLLGSGLRITLLEAGDPTDSGEPADRLGPIRMLGDPMYDGRIDVTRGHRLGGTANLWSFRMTDPDSGILPADGPQEGPQAGERGCRYAPMDPIDLQARPDVPHSGWPITRGHLDAWYPQAQRIAELGPLDYAAETWSEGDCKPLDLGGSVTSSMVQFGPASAWTGRVATRVRSDPRVRVVTGAIVAGLESTDDGVGNTTVRAVLVRFPDGGRVRVRARAVVLAAGGIENARLLLLSPLGAPGAVANPHDQVGRYFMEHPMVRGGLLVLDPGATLARELKLYDPHRRRGTTVMAELALAERVVRAEGLLSTSARLLPRDDVHATAGVRAVQQLRSPTGRRAPAGERAKTFARAAIGVYDVFRARPILARQEGVDDGGWSRRPGAGDVRVFELLQQTEQSPDPENRVTLDEAKDVHGRRTALLRWRWTADDRRRITRSRDLYAQAFEASGHGRLIGGDWSGGQPRMIGGSHHHMGGTRMSADQRTGVVDTRCRVHGLTNLYVAGSSVFPAGGSVHPTLTIVALALRLSAHLRRAVLELPALPALPALADEATSASSGAG